MSNYKPRQPVGEETSLKIGYKGRHTRQHRLAGGPLPIRIASPRAGLRSSCMRGDLSYLTLLTTTWTCLLSSSSWVR